MITIRRQPPRPETSSGHKACVPFDLLNKLIVKPHDLSMRDAATFYGVASATCYRWRSINEAPAMYGSQSEMFSRLPVAEQVKFLSLMAEHMLRYDPKRCVDRMEAFAEKYRLSRPDLGAVLGVGTTTIYDYVNQRRAPACIWMQLEIAEAMSAEAVNVWVNDRLREAT